MRSRYPSLTDREFEVWEEIVNGLENKEIGKSLHISSKWVRNCASNLYRKLGVQGRAEAISLGMELGLRRTPGCAS